MMMNRPFPFAVTFIEEHNTANHGFRSRTGTLGRSLISLCHSTQAGQKVDK